MVTKHHRQLRDITDSIWWQLWCELQCEHSCVTSRDLTVDKTPETWAGGERFSWFWFPVHQQQCMKFSFIFVLKVQTVLRRLKVNFCVWRNMPDKGMETRVWQKSCETSPPHGREAGTGMQAVMVHTHAEQTRAHSVGKLLSQTSFVNNQSWINSLSNTSTSVFPSYRFFKRNYSQEFLYQFL